MSVELDPILIPVVTTALTGLVACVAVWLTSRLALQRAHDERVWTRKADAYAAIIQSLYLMRTCYNEWEAEELERKDSSEERENEQRVRNTEAQIQLRSTLGANVWLLTENVEVRCKQLYSVLNTRHESWCEHVMECSYQLQNAQNDIVLLAKKELDRPNLFG